MLLTFGQDESKSCFPDLIQVEPVLVSGGISEQIQPVKEKLELMDGKLFPNKYQTWQETHTLSISMNRGWDHKIRKLSNKSLVKILS